MSTMKTEKRNTNNRTKNPDTNLDSRKRLFNREALRTLSAQLLEEVVGGQAHIIESATGGAGAGK